MRRRSDHPFRDGLPSVDTQTAERLLSGLPAADAPPAYATTAQALGVLRQDALDPELLGESQAVSQIAAATVSGPTTSRRSTMTRLRAAKIAAAAAAGVLSLSTGLAVAGALPGAASDVASDTLSTLGISTPGPNSHAGNHPNTRGSSAAHSTTNPAATPPAGTKGDQISDLATSTNAVGVNKGAQISTAASNGQSQAGQHGTAPTPGAPAGPSTGGTTIANQASDGHSSAGAANGAAGLAHRP
jgi:hypothetical protein